jgi:4-hydroxybenzoate polyprenyltransferase
MLNLTRTYILALRPWFWWAAIAPGVAGYLWAGQTISFMDLFWIVFILGFGLSGFAEMCNEFCDDEYDIVQRQFSAFGVNSSGGIGLSNSNHDLLRHKKRFLLFHVLFVLIIATLWSEVSIIFVIIGAIIGWAYSSKPFRLKANVLTNISSKILGYGVVSFFIGLILAGGDLSWYALLLGAAIGLIECGYNGIADINDLETDRDNGLFTLPVSVGPTFAAVIYMTFCISGLGILLANRITDPTASTTFFSLCMTLTAVTVCASLTVAVLKYTSETDKNRLSQLHLLSGITMMSSAIWLIH